MQRIKVLTKINNFIMLDTDKNQCVYLRDIRSTKSGATVTHLDNVDVFQDRFTYVYKNEEDGKYYMEPEHLYHPNKIKRFYHTQLHKIERGVDVEELYNIFMEVF